MAAPAKTHRVEVEGVGTFVFRRRTIALQIELESRSDRLTQGPVHNKELERFSVAVAALEVLTAEAPEGWDLDTMDPLDPDEFGRILLVHGSLRHAEEEFRKAARG